MKTPGPFLTALVVVTLIGCECEDETASEITVKENVAAANCVIVMFIASPGWGRVAEVAAGALGAD